MKSSLLVATLWLSTAAFALYVQPATGPTYQPPSHPDTAAPQAMGTERSLLGSGRTTSAQGERPLTDIPVLITQTHDEMPLENVTGAYRLKKNCCICPPHGHSGSIRGEKPQFNPDGRFSRLKSRPAPFAPHVTAFGSARRR